MLVSFPVNIYGIIWCLYAMVDALELVRPNYLIGLSRNRSSFNQPQGAAGIREYLHVLNKVNIE